jgi:hypothetical protein
MTDDLETLKAERDALAKEVQRLQRIILAARGVVNEMRTVVKQTPFVATPSGAAILLTPEQIQRQKNALAAVTVAGDEFHFKEERE